MYSFGVKLLFWPNQTLNLEIFLIFGPRVISGSFSIMAKIEFCHNFLLLVQYIGKCASSIPLIFWNKIGGRSIFQKNIHFRLIFQTFTAGNKENLNKWIIYFYPWPKLLYIHFPISWVIPNFELLPLMNYSICQKFDFVNNGPFIWLLAGTELNLFSLGRKRVCLVI